MGYIFFYYGCPIAWSSKLATYVTLSTNHSEYCAAAKGARQAKFMQNLLFEMDIEQRTVDTFSDSKGAIAMSYNPVHQQASKHVDLADHYVREQVDAGVLTVTYVSTNDMLADIFTKALGKAQFIKLRDAIFAC